MSQTDDAPTSTPRRYAAPVLGLFFPGVGHFAIGYWRRGLVYSAIASALLFSFGCAAASGCFLLSTFFLLLGVAATFLATADVVRLPRIYGLPSRRAVFAAAVLVFVVAQLERYGLREHLVEILKIPAASMVPTIHIGDHIVVDKRARIPCRGDVIVFTSPLNEAQDFVKRVIAIGGDTVELREGVPVVNGKPSPQHAIEGACSYLDYEEAVGRWETLSCLAFEESIDGRAFRIVHNTGATTPASRNRLAFQVPDDSYWVLGDNRDNSYDSRFLGEVPAHLVKGTARFAYWARDRSRIGEPIR